MYIMLFSIFLTSKNYQSYKMRVVKQINIKNRTYYFYNDMINIKNFDPILLKIDRKSYKILVFIILDILQLTKMMIMKLFTA